MRKIYCKSNIYYKKEFQLETAIIKAKKKKYVYKKAINEQAKGHLYDMERACKTLHTLFPNFTFCDVQRENDVLVFEFVEGVSITKNIIDRLSMEDRNGCIDWIKYQINLIETIDENICPFYFTDCFAKIFGDKYDIEGAESFKKVVFDMTTNNVIIMDENRPILIDYEWYFEFPIPKDLVKYHIIKTLYNNIQGLCSFIKMEDLVNELEIKLDLNVLSFMWTSFYDFIFQEKEYNYIKIKNKYLQKSESIVQLKEAINWHNGFRMKQDEFINKLQKRIEELEEGNAWHNNLKEEQDIYIRQLQERIIELEKGIAWHHENDKMNEEQKELFKTEIAKLEDAISWHNNEREKSRQYFEALDNRVTELQDELNKEKNKNISLHRELFEIQQNSIYKLLISKWRNK